MRIFINNKAKLMNTLLLIACIIITAFATYVVMSVVQLMSHDITTITDEYFKNKLFSNNIKVEYKKSENLYLESIFHNIEYIFLNSNNEIVGLKFNAGSERGFAIAKYEQPRLIGYDIYSVFDTNLKIDFKPTYGYRFYDYQKKILYFDGFSQRLFKSVDKDNIEEDEIQRGILDYKKYVIFQR